MHGKLAWVLHPLILSILFITHVTMVSAKQNDPDRCSNVQCTVPDSKFSTGAFLDHSFFFSRVIRTWSLYVATLPLIFCYPCLISMILHIMDELRVVDDKISIFRPEYFFLSKNYLQIREISSVCWRTLIMNTRISHQ